MKDSILVSFVANFEIWLNLYFIYKICLNLYLYLFYIDIYSKKISEST